MKAVQGQLVPGQLFFYGFHNMKSFEERILEGLKTALAAAGSVLENCHILGVAVSGGADSVSLLCALKNVLPQNINLKAVTVNHNIRPQKETSGDADYVETLCKSLGVHCTRYEIERGLVEKKSKDESNGIEDSARKIRYEKFGMFINSEKIDYLCLAHNKNDQEETVLMRLLQGSGDLSGIPVSREKFLRPLLAVSRTEIESYLAEKKISYRVDSTNLENEMMRNRIRNLLVPVLNENFPGWKKALGCLAEKSRRDKETLDCLALKAMKEIGYTEKGGAVTFYAEDFYSLQDAMKDRILMSAVKSAGPSERIPQSFLMRWTDRKYADSKKSESSSGLEFSLKNGIFTVEKKSRVATEEGFFAIIEEPGEFCAGGSSFAVKKESVGISVSCGNKKLVLTGLDFPFAFRSRQPGDEIKSSDGTMRSLLKILDGWKVLELKDRIPVFQEIKGPLQNIKCIWGSLYGFSDFIVTD